MIKTRSTRLKLARDDRHSDRNLTTGIADILKIQKNNKDLSYDISLTHTSGSVLSVSCRVRYYPCRVRYYPYRVGFGIIRIVSDSVLSVSCRVRYNPYRVGCFRRPTVKLSIILKSTNTWFTVLKYENV